MNYHVDLQTNLCLDKEMIKLEYRANNNKRTWALHCHKGYEIYYFQAGDANYLINDKIYEIEPGDMLIFNGELLHRVNPKEGTYIRSYINFMPELIEKHLEKNFPDKLKKLFETENGTLIQWRHESRKELEGLISKINEERQSGTEGYQTVVALCLTQLLIKIYRKSTVDSLSFTNAGWTQKYNHVQRILTFINHNFTDHTMTLNTIADSLHLNKYYICHCFKEITGFTINKYLGNRRIEEGKKLLLNSELTITAIASRIGLNSTVQFSRLFKKHVGISPQIYRKNYTKMENNFNLPSKM